MRTGQDVDDLLMGMASQIAEREDSVVVEDLRGFCYSRRVYYSPPARENSSDGISPLTDYMYGPLRFTRTDLVALTIQRGRDFGLQSYNSLRKALALPPVNTFEEINPELNRTNPQVKAEG